MFSEHTPETVVMMVINLKDPFRQRQASHLLHRRIQAGCNRSAIAYLHVVSVAQKNGGIFHAHRPNWQYVPELSLSMLEQTLVQQASKGSFS